MIKYCKYLIWLYSGLCTFAVGQTEYAQWLKDQQREINAMVAEENEYLASVTQEFDNYVKDQERLFEEFKKEVEKKWDDFRFSSNKTYVDYDKDLNARGSVNFEKGEVEVEVIVEDDPAKSDKEKQKLAETKLKKKVTDLVQKKGEDDKALLKKQLQTTSGKEVSKQNAKSFSEEVIKEKKVTAKKIKSGDGKKRILYKVKIKMIPNHLEVRAKQFKNEVLKQSKRFKIDPAVVFAIIHTESSFNPKARSHIPAFGLMQLVPKSGARDAYNFVYKKDRLLRGKYLYNPKNNIELGCAYFSKLRHVYFKDVSNSNSAYYCAISAYNTGPGNVAKALTGKTRLKQTAIKVNSSSSKEVHKMLMQNLPYQETKNYLKKVTERINIYREWT